MEQENNNFFAAIPHSIFNLKPIDLYILFYLHTKKSYFNKSFTASINLIASEVKIYKKQQQNKEMIKQSLFDLKSNEIIYFKEKNIKHNSYFNISFCDIKGYTKIPYVLFSFCLNKPERFMVLCLIKRWYGINYKISTVEMAEAINKTEKYTSKLINKMIEDKIIKNDDGKYSINFDRLNKPKAENKTEEKAENVNDEIKENETNKESESESENETEKEINYGNWKSGKLTENDAKLMLLQKDNEEFNKVVNKRIKNLRNTDNGELFYQNTFKKWINEAENQIKKEREREEREQEQKEKEEREQVIFNQAAKIKGTPIELKNNEIVNIDENTDFDEVNRLFYFNNGEIKTINYNDLFLNAKEKTKPDLFNWLIKRSSFKDKLQAEDIEEFFTYRDNLFAKNNSKLEHNQEHEGDIFECYGINAIGELDIENISLRNRIYQKKKEEQEHSIF